MSDIVEQENDEKQEDEELPVLTAQRFLNIFRQIHIFSEKKKKQFDEELLGLSGDVIKALGTLPGTSLLLDHIDELKGFSGNMHKKKPENIEENLKSAAKSEKQPQKTLVTDNQQIVAPMFNAAQYMPMNANFSEELSASLATVLEKIENKHNAEMAVLMNSMIATLNAIVSKLGETGTKNTLTPVIEEKISNNTDIAEKDISMVAVPSKRTENIEKESMTETLPQNNVSVPENIKEENNKKKKEKSLIKPSPLVEPEQTKNKKETKKNKSVTVEEIKTEAGVPEEKSEEWSWDKLEDIQSAIEKNAQERQDRMEEERQKEKSFSTEETNVLDMVNELIDLDDIGANDEKMSSVSQENDLSDGLDISGKEINTADKNNELNIVQQEDDVIIPKEKALKVPDIEPKEETVALSNTEQYGGEDVVLSDTESEGPDTVLPDINAENKDDNEDWTWNLSDSDKDNLTPTKDTADNGEWEWKQEETSQDEFSSSEDEADSGENWEWEYEDSSAEDGKNDADNEWEWEYEEIPSSDSEDQQSDEDWEWEYEEDTGKK